MKYNQKQNNIGKELSLKNAINYLTKHRKKLTPITKNYLKRCV